MGNLGNEIIEDHEEAMQSFSRSTKDTEHRGERGFQKALCTLFINGISQESNRWDALLSFFQNFGEVIDIHIPLNGEKAFVQFSNPKEAEAALKSSLAVMGNRFIKLFWAYRDNIAVDGQNSDHKYKSVRPPGIVVSSIPSKHPVAIGGKETLAISAQRRSNVVATETPIPAANGGMGTLPISAQIRINKVAAERPVHAAVPVKRLTSNAPKVVPSVQKKMKKLELLDGLRKKQESLAKKCEDFKHQLNKFEIQACSTKRGDVLPEQAVKRHEGSEAEKAPVTPGIQALTPLTPTK